MYIISLGLLVSAFLFCFELDIGCLVGCEMRAEGIRECLPQWTIKSRSLQGCWQGSGVSHDPAEDLQPWRMDLCTVVHPSTKHGLGGQVYVSLKFYI